MDLKGMEDYSCYKDCSSKRKNFNFFLGYGSCTTL